MPSFFKKRFLYALLLSLVLFCTTNAENWPDSILKILPTLADTSQVNQLNKLSNYFSDKDFDKSKKYALRAIHLADSIQYHKGHIVGLDNMGYIAIITAAYSDAIKTYQEAIKITLQINLTTKLAWLYNRLSAAYYYQGNYEEAVQNYLKTIEYAKKTNNKNTILDAYNGLANIYMAKSDYANTEKYYREAHRIARDIGDSSSIALIENNLGVMYEDKKSYSESMQHYSNALEIYKSLHDSSSIALTLANIAYCSSSMGDDKKAMNYFNQAIEIYSQKNDKNGLALCYINLATVFSKTKVFDKAIEYFNKGLFIGKQIGRKELIKTCYEELGNVYYQTGKYQKAYDYYKMYSDVKDSLFNETNTKNINELQTKFETEKKENEIVRLNLENDAQTARIKQQNIRTYFIATALLLVLVIVFVVYRQYKATRIINKELADKNSAINHQKREIENQKLIVENQNKEITDSINYARQIQQAILPSEMLISKSLPNHFILYKPKAIVSGDFYFFSEKKDKLFIAVVDCTGHGVPGAFMSMIGNNLLTQIINEKEVSDPSEILNQLHRAVRHVLQQDVENAGNRDGMDISLIALHKNLKTLEFAGANRPLYLIRNGKLVETKGDKSPIGGMQFELQRKFSLNKIELEKNDSIYLFSDGYADQFGGEKGRKFMVKNLQKSLLEINGLPFNKQRDKLDSIIENWKGNLEQIDDILVIGIQV
ncbi:MAG: tetratricopeptide repeat protein [Bacteroidia bacterium]|nr:tetratricopeptide repeat protein [Bacteroidia bacterium]